MDDGLQSGEASLADPDANNGSDSDAQSDEETSDSEASVAGPEANNRPESVEMVEEEMIGQSCSGTPNTEDYSNLK